MATKYLTAFIACLLAGCATCERHPVVCTVGAAVAIGAIAAIDRHHHAEMQDWHVKGPYCHPETSGQCAP